MRKKNLQLVYFIIPPRFDEEAMVFCLCRLREAGIPVELVSMNVGLEVGGHGIVVRPDKSLSELELHLAQQSVTVSFILGSGLVNEVVLADPRIYRLLQKALDHAGMVAAMTPVDTHLLEDGYSLEYEHNNLLAQGAHSLEDFTSQIMLRLG